MSYYVCNCDHGGFSGEQSCSNKIPVVGYCTCKCHDYNHGYQSDTSGTYEPERPTLRYNRYTVKPPRPSRVVRPIKPIESHGVIKVSRPDARRRCCYCPPEERWAFRECICACTII